jgi:hypothetical protein
MRPIFCVQTGTFRRTADAQGVRERSECFKSDAEQIHVLNLS